MRFRRTSHSRRAWGDGWRQGAYQRGPAAIARAPQVASRPAIDDGEPYDDAPSCGGQCALVHRLPVQASSSCS